MAKANSGKVVHMLSPENYIRKMARTLPIYECLVNTDWEESKMANVAIARQHTNGNITACIYLVDLMCLGIKDTTYMFNITLFEYKEKIDIIRDGSDISQISYTLAHNIVFAGLEFAEEYGFSPHKDFTSITSFMLEEDNDDIELIDIECGYKGKPAYIRSPSDNRTKADKIISQLEKTVGTGNFMIIDEADEYDDMEDFDEENDEFFGKTFEEKKEVFLQLFSRLDSLTPDEDKRFSNVTSSAFNDLCEPDLIDKYYDEYFDELDINILPDDEIPDELLGIIPGSVTNSLEIKELFMDVYDSIEGNLENAREKWKSFRALAKDIPAVAFLELNLLKYEESPEYIVKLKKYSSEYKDYPLIRLSWLIELATSENLTDENLLKKIEREVFFPGRQFLHRIELIYYLLFFLYAITAKYDPSKLEAFSVVLSDFDDLSDNYMEVLFRIIFFMKIKIVANYLQQ